MNKRLKQHEQKERKAYSKMFAPAPVAAAGGSAAAAAADEGAAAGGGGATAAEGSAAMGCDGGVEAEMAAIPGVAATPTLVLGGSSEGSA